MNEKLFTNRLPEKGISSLSVLRYCRKAARCDFRFKSDCLLGSMCTPPPPLAARCFLRSIDVNLGDPGLFPGTVALERQSIAILARLLNGGEATGVFTTGGTESNLIAVQTALMRYLARHPHQRDRSRLRLIVPQSAHFSFDKAARLMGFQLVKVPLTAEGQMDVAAARQCLDEHCFGLVGVAGTTGLGIIDPLSELSELALENDLYLHVDAAFGGFVIPFMPLDFRRSHPFDFSLPGVQSITVDPHKMGRGVIPGGALLFRNGELFRSSATEVGYLSGGRTRQLTLSGTRSGGAVAAALASLLHEGENGYRKRVRRAMALTDFLKTAVLNLPGYRLKAMPSLNVIGIEPLFIPAEALGRRLREKKVAVSVFEDYIRIVMMPHVSKRKIGFLIRSLKEIYGDSQSSGS